MTAALILAGGRGGRLSGGGIPKQFREVCGRPLISYCLSAFERCARVGAVCIVAADEWRGPLRGGGRVFAGPGETRQHSVLNGLLALRSLRPGRVVIHDAARPLVTAEDIERCLDAMEGYDGATPALPVSDTVYQSEDGRVISSLLNRDWLYAGQTPECYDFEKYLKAHGPLNGPELARIRGGSEIAFMSGMSIALCEGNPMNFKVTDDAGMAVFQSIVSGGGV